MNSVKTNFVWNGQNLASETKNNVTTSYTYDPTGVILSKADNAPTVRFVKDPHGNVAATSKNNHLDNYLISVAFENDDLYYSIHKSDIYLNGYKCDDGKWINYSCYIRR